MSTLEHQSDISAYSHGLMSYKTPNIDRAAKEGEAADAKTNHNTTRRM